MKLFAIALLVAGSSAFAQQRVNPAGWGSVLYPGTGGPPPASAHGGFGSALYPGTGGPPRNGGASRGFIPPPQAAHPSHGRTVIVPYPVYYGGYYYDPSVPAAQQSAPAYYYDDPNGQAPAQSPVVILNQSFRPDVVNPVLRDYPNMPPPENSASFNGPPNDQATIYLISLTDHTILATIAYWVEGDTLAYITVEGNQNRISMALVDREFSSKLNADRNVEFHLPAAK